MLTFIVIVFAAHYFAKQGMPKLGAAMAISSCLAQLSKISENPQFEPVIYYGTGLSLGLMLLGSILIVRYRMSRKTGRK